MLEHLRAICTTLADHSRDMRERVSSIERRVALIHGDIANIHSRLDDCANRLDRRLDGDHAPV